MKIRLVAALAALTSVLAASPLSAALVPTVIFSENFNGGLPGAGFNIGGSGAVTGVSNQAQLVNSGGDLSYYTTDTFSGETFTVEGDVTQINGSVGGTANGLIIGNRLFAFFADYLPTPGAFNIRHINPVTASITGLTLPDKDMTYVPAMGDKQHFKIDVDPFTNTFDITINNTAGPGTFNWTQVDGGFIPGVVGFYNWAGGHTTLFDNLEVIALRDNSIVPEPATWTLLGLGAAALAWRVKRRKAA